MIGPHMALDHTYLMRSTYSTFGELLTELDRVIAHEKKEFLTTSPARRLTDLWVPIQFLSPSQP
jgi:hypothetical protein